MIIHTVTLPLHHVQMPDRSCVWADVLFAEETEELPENSKKKNRSIHLALSGIHTHQNCIYIC